MKISTAFAAVFMAVSCALSPASAEEQASLHLRIHTKENICYKACPPGQYCENGTGTLFCRAPSYKKECFNPATGHYQNGCSAGFACKNNKCQKA